MKKIILILALALGVKVNAQIVGGYLPVNSTKTATMGGLKVAGNETVTGTFSVGSTATITGALKASSTMSLGSANLTGGNTGTVAVLDDAYFPVTFAPNLWNPLDATSYYIGNTFYPPNSFATMQGTVNIPYNSTLKYWQLNYIVSGTAPTSETATLIVRVNGTNTQTLTTSITFTNATTHGGFSGSVNQNYNASDKIDCLLITPTYVTNPTSVYISILLGYVRRS